MEKRVAQTMKALQRNRFDVRFAERAETARKMVLDIIPVEAAVGIGDSATVRQVGILAELEKRGTKLINPFDPEIHRQPELFQRTVRETFRSDVFLTGSNTVTLDGKLVNTDMVGNRVAGMVFAAKKVVLIVGTNKIVKNANEAQRRLKGCITPYHAAHKGRKVPCVVSGKCADCSSPERICNVTVILEGKPFWTDLTIILVNEDLGLGWNPAWSEKRINRIKAAYEKVTEAVSVSTRKA